MQSKLLENLTVPFAKCVLRIVLMLRAYIKAEQNKTLAGSSFVSHFFKGHSFVLGLIN